MNRNLLFLFFLIFSLTFFSTPDSVENISNISLTSGTMQFSSKDENGNLNEFVIKILDSYKNTCINGTRIFMETGERIRYRYEFVLRNGYDKIVSLKMPYHVTWFRNGEKGFIVQNGMKTQVEVDLKDLEDVFIEKLGNNDSEFYVTEINYSGIPAYYCFIKMGPELIFRVIFLQNSFQIIRIERESSTNMSIMLYDNLNDSDVSTFGNQIKWYSDFPEETEENASDGMTLVPTDTAQSPEDSLSDEIDKRFGFYIKNIENKFNITKSDLIEFSDVFALFLTIAKDKVEKPIGLVMISPKNGVSLKDMATGSIIDKIPEGYNSYQFMHESIELNIMGEFTPEELKEFSVDITGNYENGR